MTGAIGQLRAIEAYCGCGHPIMLGATVMTGEVCIVDQFRVIKAYRVCNRPAVLSKYEKRLQELNDKYLRCPIDLATVSSSDESEKATKLPIGAKIDTYA